MHESGRTSVAVVIETVKEFVSFAYEVLLDDRRGDHQLLLRIMGIHTPLSVMPGTGPARGVRFYDTLRGKTKIIVKKLSGEANEFEIDIRQGGVNLLKAPLHPFIQFTNEPIREGLN